MSPLHHSDRGSRLTSEQSQRLITSYSVMQMPRWRAYCVAQDRANSSQNAPAGDEAEPDMHRYCYN